MPGFRIVLVCLTLLLSVLSLPAYADSREIDTFSLPFFPCLASAPDAGVPPTPGSGANDGAFPHICFVNLGGIPGNPHPSWQASTGEWILFRASDGVFATESQCEQAAAAIAVAGELDAAPATFERSCLQNRSGAWVVSLRLLSHPLSPGEHTVSLTVTLVGGTTLTGTQTIMVTPQG